MTVAVAARPIEMKLLHYILLFVSISACCGTTKTVEKTDTSETTEIAMVKQSKTADTSATIIAKKPVIEIEDEKEEQPTHSIPSEVSKEEVTTEPGIADSEAFDHSLWNSLLQKHVSDLGNVNYKGFRSDIVGLRAYLSLLSENPPQDTWSKDDTLAYWMNVYNAFTVKLILDNYPTKSIKDIKGPWSHRFIRIGEKWYTLNDVEHRIIRKMNEPRIHFALVCAAVSCPRLYNKAFTAKRLEDDLSMLTKGFLNDPDKNNLSENSIKLSKIFKWYGGDFKKNGASLIDFLNEYSNTVIAENAKTSYMDYNWSLNE